MQMIHSQTSPPSLLLQIGGKPRQHHNPTVRPVSASAAPRAGLQKRRPASQRHRRPRRRKGCGYARTEPRARSNETKTKTIPCAVAHGNKAARAARGRSHGILGHAQPLNAHGRRHSRHTAAGSSIFSVEQKNQSSFYILMSNST